jgi:hypothetical protein
MGWEFAAVWLDDTRPAWHWVWRRIADDSGKLLEQSPPFRALARCAASKKTAAVL